MPAYPIEIVTLGHPDLGEYQKILDELNGLQSEFRFTLPRPEHRSWGIPYRQISYTTDFIWEKLDEYRQTHKGFHPFIISVIHGVLESNTLSNLFGDNKAEAGMAVVTTKDWSDHFAPPALSVYLMYYFVRYTMSFIAPEIKVHNEERTCYFHSKIEKKTIKDSMESGRLCDSCAKSFADRVDGFTYQALLCLIEHVQARATTAQTHQNRPTVFIGSSTEGRQIAEHIQISLDEIADCTIWSQGVFDLTKNTLESLEQATASFDYAVLVLTADDVAVKRCSLVETARDNVIFELGLFMGALGRERTFIVHPREQPPTLPTDLLGIMTAQYSVREDGNLDAALGPACTRLKHNIIAGPKAP
jgi:predicted nucleotide-binding protein